MMQDNQFIIQAQSFRRPVIDNLLAVEQTVEEILTDIQLNGDEAVNRWSEQIDKQKARFIELKAFGDYDLDEELAEAIQFAYSRIKNFCEFQIKNLKTESFNDEIGDFASVYQPLQSIGAYIPAGRFPLISTALMTLTPAQVAGCPIRIACSPSENPALLAAASLAGATGFLQLGGAQAIGALSYGFDTIKPVNMIVGPGNAYVNSAKAQIQHRTKIDTLAGPSELLIYANELTHPDWIILDALAQAEDDKDAVSIIVSTSETLLQTLYETTKKDESAQMLLESRQILFVLADNESQAIDIINDYAPEHLLVCDENMDMSVFVNYGSLFIGENSAVAFGDYCSGPNHTLPTNGMGKSYGGLGVHQFMKVLTTQKISNAGRTKLSGIANILAKAEGLEFHRKSADVRK